MLKCFDKEPAEALDFTAVFDPHCIIVRQALNSYATNACVQPITGTGFQYRALNTGTTGRTEPRWPEIIGGEVTDGSVTWVAEPITVESLRRTLVSAQWSSDAGLTIGSQADWMTTSTAIISGGTLGQTYRVQVDGQFSDTTVRSIVWQIHVIHQQTC
jgi:hypothetical protein